MCSLNLNLLSITIPKYFIVDTCCKGLLFKYMLISLFSFLFLLDIIITLDLSSLKLILLFLDQPVILLTLMFEIFSAALIVSFLTANIKSSANATALEFFACVYIYIYIYIHAQKLLCTKGTIFMIEI